MRIKTESRRRAGRCQVPDRWCGGRRLLPGRHSGRVRRQSPPGRSAIPCAHRPRRTTAPTCPGRRPPSPSEPRQRGGLPRGGSSPSGGGRPRPQDESEPEKGPSEPEGEAPEADAVLDAEENGDKVVEFPEEESPLASFLKDISKRRMTTPTVCLRSRSRWTQRRSAAWRP